MKYKCNNKYKKLMENNNKHFQDKFTYTMEMFIKNFIITTSPYKVIIQL